MFTIIFIVIIAVLSLFAGIATAMALLRPGVLTSMTGAFGDVVEGAVNKMTGRAAVHRIQAAINRHGRQLTGSVADIETVQQEIQRLQRLLIEDENDERRLAKRIKDCLTVNDDVGAAEFAKSLSVVRSNKATNQADLTDFQKQYTDIMAGFHDSLQQIEEAKRDAGRDAARLRTAKVKGNAADVARRLNVSFSADGDLAALRNQVKEQMDEANAKAKVAEDLNSKHRQERQYQQRERDAAAQDILAEFKAKQTQYDNL